MDSDKEVWSCSAFFHISPFQQSKPEGNLRRDTVIYIQQIYRFTPYKNMYKA